MHNLNLAFDIAEKHLDIPRMLEAEGQLTLHVPHVLFNVFFVLIFSCATFEFMYLCVF